MRSNDLRLKRKYAHSYGTTDLKLLQIIVEMEIATLKALNLNLGFL